MSFFNKEKFLKLEQKIDNITETLEQQTELFECINYKISKIEECQNNLLSLLEKNSIKTKDAILNDHNKTIEVLQNNFEKLKYSNDTIVELLETESSQINTYKTDMTKKLKQLTTNKNTMEKQLQQITDNMDIIYEEVRLLLLNSVLEQL